jgi:NADH dehydrogenase
MSADVETQTDSDISMGEADGEQLMPVSAGDDPHVVIIGAGFGGINAAKRLGRTDAKVTIIDRRNHHLFQPLLYQVATAGLNPGDIATPVRSVVGQNDNTNVRMSKATRIDRAAQVVYLEEGRPVAYDYLIVACGAKTKRFGDDSWVEHSTGLKTVGDALELRHDILLAFERAEQAEDPADIEAWLTFGIVGAGPTGVEMAGAIREIAAEVMVRDFDTIDPEEARVVLIDAADNVLPGYPDELCQHAEEELEQRGVEVVTGAPVEEITETSISAAGKTWSAQTVVWAAGVEPVPLVDTLQTEQTNGGQAVVDEDLTLPGDERVMVIGDAAFFAHNTEEPLPGLAPVALQQGKHAAKNILAAIDSDENDASVADAYEGFEYFDKGTLSTIGRSSAVGEVRGWQFTGFVAWVVWLVVHLFYLIGFRNRAMVLFQWIYSYLVFRRGARLIVESEGYRPPKLESEDEQDSTSGG